MDIIPAKEPTRPEWFTARIELPDKPEGDYVRLHADMKKAGYARIIKGAKRSYHLPHATYVKQITGLTVGKVRDAVTRIAKKSHPSPRVLVIEGPLAWSNLVPVTAANPDPDVDS